MSDVFKVVKLLPLHYMHVKDVNKNIVKVVTGPRTFYCEEFEEASEPMRMISIPAEHYVIIDNPVVRDKKGEVVVNENGEDKLHYGEEEVRFHQEPFPLYFGETAGKVLPLPVLNEDEALVVRAKRDFENGVGRQPGKRKLAEDSKPRKAGEMWQIKGPLVYYPTVGVEIISKVSPIVLGPNEALHLRAVEDCLDWEGTERKAGEEWIVKLEGGYLPQVHEEVVAELVGHVLTHKKGIHVRAKRTFFDEKCKKKRKAGEEWLVTRKDTEVYFPGVNEEIIKADVALKVLTEQEYCFISDPYDEETGKLRLGATELRKGPTTFFLQPGEVFLSEKKARVLKANEGVWVSAKEEFTDNGKKRRPGDEWFISGPGVLWEPMEIKVQRHVNAIISLWPVGVHFFHPGSVALFALVLLVLGWLMLW